MATADIWADPICPWTWLTAQWLLEVERVRDVQARFHVMSLSVLNGDPVELRAAWAPVRVLTVTALSVGGGAVRDLYVAMATLIHHHGRQTYDRDFFAESLTRAGLPHSLANAATSPFYDDEVRASHQSGIGPAGDGVGCPIVHLRRTSGEVAAFFGPVVNPCPRGEAAGRLWDSVALAAETDSFYELKRARVGAPVFD